MKTNKKGFTIIEVVLVLAIAGLIFLMVFIALPALQRSQRNTQREDDLARVLTAVNDFQTNNNGKTPFNGLDMVAFVQRYLDKDCKGDSNAAVLSTTAGNATKFTECGQQFSDPDGTAYNIVFKGKAPSGEGVGASGSSVGLTEFDHKFYAYYNASCGDEGMVKPGSGDREVAIFFVEEGGAIACNDNH